MNTKIGKTETLHKTLGLFHIVDKRQNCTPLKRHVKQKFKLVVMTMISDVSFWVQVSEVQSL